MVRHSDIGLVAALSLSATALGQACRSTVVQNAIPASTQYVALQSYSYCGGTLNVSSYIAKDQQNQTVTLYYADGQERSTPLSSLLLSYQSSVPKSNWEIWTASLPVYYDGISRLDNLTSQITGTQQVHVQQLNKPVTASGAPVPTLPSPPAPYATPKGFGNDVTNYLSANSSSQAGLSMKGLFRNINPAIDGAAPGTVVAAQSGPSFNQTNPNYEFTWVVDSSFGMEVVHDLYAAATEAEPKAQYQNVLFQYATARATEQTDPNLQFGLGEPKFYMNNTIFSGTWPRPQNDGAATASINLMRFATSYLAAGGSPKTVKEKIYDSTHYPKAAPVQKDLLFLASNWSSPSYDVWEEVLSTHFYNRLVSRRALLMGIEFAKLMNDSTTAATLSAAEQKLTPTLGQFWNHGRGILLYQYGPAYHGKYSYLDTAVILAIIHGYAGDGIFSYTNEQVLSTTVRVATSFINVFPVANATQKTLSGPLGIPNGRYPEDIYDGYGYSKGNPWYGCTISLAQFMWAASAEYGAAGKVAVTDTSIDFFNYFAPDSGVKVGQTYGAGSSQYDAVIASVNGWGDAFMRNVEYYTPAGGRLTEEYNRSTGAAQGAIDLTFSHAALLTAALQRATLRGQKSYAANLANLGFSPNS